MAITEEIERFAADGDDGKQYIVTGWAIQKSRKPVDLDAPADQYMLDTCEEVERLTYNEYVIKKTKVRLNRRAYLNVAAKPK